MMPNRRSNKEEALFQDYLDLMSNSSSENSIS